jgi:hypothetical protein
MDRHFILHIKKLVSKYESVTYTTVQATVVVVALF